VAVSVAVSNVLHIPQDVLMVKKIGTPGNPELAIGAQVPEGQLLDIRDKTIILTDDGAATGATMESAIRWAQDQNAKKIIVALPVAPPETAVKLQRLVNDVIILETPADFSAVGQYYRDFTQVTDEDVVQLRS
jgi:predicted phosphoribosyltransferase